MEVKDTKQTRRNLLTIACIVAIIAGATTAVSFAVTGHDPITTASNLVKGRGLLASDKILVGKTASKGSNRLILREGGVMVYSDDWGRTWRNNKNNSVVVSGYEKVAANNDRSGTSRGIERGPDKLAKYAGATANVSFDGGRTWQKVADTVSTAKYAAVK
jgi:hypothetical protein